MVSTVLGLGVPMGALTLPPKWDYIVTILGSSPRPHCHGPGRDFSSWWENTTAELS